MRGANLQYCSWHYVVTHRNQCLEIEIRSQQMRSNLLLASLLVLAVHGADPNKPHIHKGSIEPFKPGPPPPLSAKDLATLNSGKPVQQTVEVNGAGRAMATFDVAAPPSLVWDCILDLKNYPRMVPGVSAVELYRGPTTSGGVTLTSAKWTLSMLGYRVSYFVETRYEPRLQSMTFRLDYSRESDLDDSVGYWHVAPLPQADGRMHSRVTYMAALGLRGYWPKAIIDILFATTLGKATAWVGVEASKRLATSGGAAVSTKCRWSWKRMRKVCAPPSSPPSPEPPPGPSLLRQALDACAVALSVLWMIYFVRTETMLGAIAGFRRPWTRA